MFLADMSDLLDVTVRMAPSTYLDILVDVGGGNTTA